MRGRARRVFLALWLGGALMGLLGQLIYVLFGWRWAAGASAVGLVVMMVQVIRLFLFQAKGVNVFRKETPGGDPQPPGRNDPHHPGKAAR